MIVNETKMTSSCSTGSVTRAGREKTNNACACAGLKQCSVQQGLVFSFCAPALSPSELWSLLSEWQLFFAVETVSLPVAHG